MQHVVAALFNGRAVFYSQQICWVLRDWSEQQQQQHD
jgi:hypothetical protein